MPDTRCLSFHAKYRCQHRGACCTASWPIPVEVDRLTSLRSALAAGALRTSPQTHPDAAFIAPDDAPSEAPALLATVDGRCVFYDAGERRCQVHRALGPDALPLSCRQFPRMSLHDSRGVSVTLSHYCPTAAGLLDSPEPVAIVTDAEAFPANGECVGLDATTSLPPLLRPDMLMDWESWWECERLSIALIAAAEDSPELAVSRLAVAIEHARTWTPSDGSLFARVREAFGRADNASIAPRRWSKDEARTRREEVLDAVPADFRPATSTHAARSQTPPSPHAVSRLIAAHAFANWTAHLGRGLRTWLRSVEAPLVLIHSGLDVRTADLWLRHLVDPKRLAESWSEAESCPATPPP